MSSNQDLLYNKKDYSSFANSHEVITTDIKLEWTLDFENKRISGSVDHVIKVLVDNASSIILDSRSVQLLGDILIEKRKVNYTVAEEHPVLGTKITIDIPNEFRKKDTVFCCHIPYAVDSNASAVQWLEPSATAGKKYPYVFTQCQAIHARSLFPCMDSPGIKTSYSAKVTAPAWCTVLMSALASQSITDENNGNNNNNNNNNGNNSSSNSNNGDVKVFNWTQPVPTSPYLVALCAGKLDKLDVSSRVRIWSEPEVIHDAHNEFHDTEDFVATAELITGCPYQWNRYDVVCLPPSFPYGGMENPCLTFATPTLLAGDRSLADVIAHEIAHSWTGNLVTNSVWDHFWLNEGWTVWLERKITSKFKRNDEVGKLSAEIGLVHLHESIEQQGADSKFTQLVWPLRGEDPDDAFSSIPYEKGFNLLNYLENLVGSENFDVFVKSYIQEFKFKTVTTGEFRDHFVTVITHHLMTGGGEAAGDSNVTGSGQKKKKNKGKGSANSSSNDLNYEKNQTILKTIKSLDWDDLFLSKGFPTYPIDFKNSLSLAAKVLSKHWMEIAKFESTNKKFTPQKSDIAGWSSQQLCLFLDTLLEESTSQQFPIPLAVLEKMGELYGFNKSKNAEIRLRWQSLCLKSNAEWIVPQVIEFITEQGRMKFVRPLYRLFRSSKVGGQKANEVFQQHKMMYHPIARKMLEADLKRLDEAEKAAANAPAAPAPAPTPAPAPAAAAAAPASPPKKPQQKVEKVEEERASEPEEKPKKTTSSGSNGEKAAAPSTAPATNTNTNSADGQTKTVIIGAVDIPSNKETATATKSTFNGAHKATPSAPQADPLWEKKTPATSKPELPSDEAGALSTFTRNAVYLGFFAGLAFFGFQLFKTYTRTRR